MPAGPADGRVEAERRALTTPSMAPASRARWSDDWISACNREASARNTFVVYREISVWFASRILLANLDANRCTPAARSSCTFTGRNDDLRHNQRLRERPRLDSLGSLAEQDTGVVHAIVGSPTATPTPAVTAAQSAAAVARPAKDSAIPTLARSESSRSHQG
jgi:hypothetical protein